VVYTVRGARGEQGPPGVAGRDADAGRDIILPCDEVLPPGTPVAVVGNKIVAAKATGPDLILGLVKEQNESGTVCQIDGVFTMEDWGLDPGATYYLDVDGGLTDTAPIGAGVRVCQIGFSLTPESLRLTCPPPIKI
jgi:hypothetical protein